MMWPTSRLMASEEDARALEKRLLARIEELEKRVAELETKGGPEQTAATTAPAAEPLPLDFEAKRSAGPMTLPLEKTFVDDSGKTETSPLAFSDGTTITMGVDTGYGYDFNHPVGRTNLLHSNDSMSNSFTLHQANIIVERTPNVSAGQRAGYRLDLMFGQDTVNLQGTLATEPHTQVYRNIYQAYGSYVFPIGHGLQVDFGKFASAFGSEGIYAKDQLNYSRSFLFGMLPAYHEGVRTTYNPTGRISVQYWLVNGLGQTEDFNGFKSQAVLATIRPNDRVTWGLNYYIGREQRDMQSGLDEEARAAMAIPEVKQDGRLHLMDTWVNVALTPKWTTVLEADYLLNRNQANSTPQVVYGLAGYLKRQLTSALSLTGRFEYLRDRDGYYSGTAQNLRDITLTGTYQLTNRLQARMEFRRDFSNQQYFLTSTPSVLSRSQTMATIGMLWWFGGKEGAW